MKITSLIFIALVTVACSSTEKSQTKINALEINDKLVKGKTSQSQVLENFGTPDVVEKTPEGDMWAYSRRSNESSSVGGGISHYISSAGFWNWTGMNVGGDSSSSSTKTASLVLHFHQDKTLRTYTFRTEKF
ncbi:hypothetical protein [Peredibacter starrii]|uniref:Lipoprotein SmpA/OmlA domain-containing protein n=1 Tax=Peredibacter starrii TaxID=28202 RepID=A0AAX4HRV7_9BACT|nr:hypothetical protein [Peredibacter starrii]WPU65806.1 hypothetical protein SOO65_03505 [Peredibacter starrii]